MAKILVVDDQASVRLRVRSLLEAAGHHITEAANGYDALKAMEMPHDLVITDVLMPEMDGLEIVAHLRRKGSSSLVLVISGGWKDESIDVLDVAKKLGANRILSKADITAKLVPTVADMLGATRPARP
ncbi:MAG TPA: response regulator [Stellaceae bacterium]|jgi:PleD family two-component response regulator|nr:response regulator [Stellaceae bacterium]